jgi:anaerobic nitric oxide reductase transcription regulator
VQAKLLRVLQSGQLQRLGSDREHHVDVRVIAATNRNLADEVRLGRYRADFYHRLSVYPLSVPPLRDRGRDVLLIAGYFLEENRARLGLRSLRLSAEAQAALVAYPWPGNIRELEHLVGRSALKALASHRERPRILSLAPADLGLSEPTVPALADTSTHTPAIDLRTAVTAYERQLIVASMARHESNWTSMARELGMDRANLNRLARRLGLK